ncbi:MAG: precorrin-2 C(20)-methyltransferase [Paracoccaceae bacterium]
MSGVLYGVGLGPGDPELMTVKAARLVAGAQVVAYPAPVGGASFVRSIAAGLIGADVREIVIAVPMNGARGPAQAAYDRGAAAIGEALRGGDDVVCLCEGDPFFYGSFMYLFARLRDEFRIEVVPGVSSIHAGAARARLPLVARNEALTVLAAPLAADELRRRIKVADSVVIMKLGRHLAKVRGVIAEMGLIGQAVYLARIGLADEVVCPLAAAPAAAPYFSMILLNKGGDVWL